MAPEIRITLADLTDPASPTRLPDDATGVDWGNWTECFDIIQESWHDPAGPQEGIVVIGHPGPCDMHREMGNPQDCPMAPADQHPLVTAANHGMRTASILTRTEGNGVPPMVWWDDNVTEDQQGWVYRSPAGNDTILGASDPDDYEDAIAEALGIPVGAIEVAEHLGVFPATVAQWRQRGLLPDPDWTVGGRPAWRLGTILAWARETGRL
jgi:hypothetical protein